MTTHDNSWGLLTSHDGSWPFIWDHVDSWQFMTIHDNSWRLMTIHDGSWHFMTAHDNSGRLMTIYDGSWRFMTAHDDSYRSWQFMTVHIGSWRFMPVHDGSWWLLTIHYNLCCWIWILMVWVHLDIGKSRRQTHEQRIPRIARDPIGSNKLCCTALGHFKSWKISISHYWFKSYGAFCRIRQYFAYWWSCIKKGLHQQHNPV